MKRSKLQKFMHDHPIADLAIVHNTDTVFSGWSAQQGEEAVDIVWNCRVVATYSRRRDAWRALKECGYKQEGLFWRRMLAADQPPRFCEPVSESE